MVSKTPRIPHSGVVQILRVQAIGKRWSGAHVQAASRRLQIEGHNA